MIADRRDRFSLAEDIGDVIIGRSNDATISYQFWHVKLLVTIKRRGIVIIVDDPTSVSNPSVSLADHSDAESTRKKTSWSRSFART